MVRLICSSALAAANIARTNLKLQMTPTQMAAPISK
jgi:hypothetical protein